MKRWRIDGGIDGVRIDGVSSFFQVATGFLSSRLWLFVVLSSHRPGTYPAYVRIIEEAADRAIFFAHLTLHPRFETNDVALAAAARLRCSFAHAGRYTVQIWFYQERGSDVLKGELPFFVAKEGD